MTRPAASPPSGRPPSQFSLLGLMVVMLAFSAALAPAYYLMRGQQGQANMHFVGILAVLAGPPLVMVAVSLLVALLLWWRR